jgi:hypothetical protein
MQISLKYIERRETPAGFAALIEIEERSYGVSRLDGEDAWTIDSTFIIANGLPVHVNGYGARYLRTSVLAYEPAVDLLNEARFEMATGEGRR